MRTALTIGREPDNDLVIDLPIVSGHHARLTWEGVSGQGVIEDLGSSNGTAVGQVDRKVTRATVTASDVVYFGNHPVEGSELLGWVDPSLAPGLMLHGPEMVVGRDPGCHRVIDRPTISGRHARFRRSGERIVLEDLGSSNGTFVNGLRVEGPTVVKFGDLIGLGADTFRLATGKTPVAGTRRIEAAGPASRHPASTTMAVGSPAPVGLAAAGWARPGTLLALLAQAPFLALAIGLYGRANQAEQGGPALARALSALALAAAWFGLSTAASGLLIGPGRERPWTSRLAPLAGLCLGECLLAGLVAPPLLGMAGPGPATVGLLVLAGWVGMAAGGLAVGLAPGRVPAWSAVAALFLAFALFGGGPASLPRSALAVGTLAGLSPARWAFEGLLDLEAEARARPEGGPDVAEDAFPAATDRMGPRASALALGSMLVGLAGLGAFLVRSSGAGR